MKASFSVDVERDLHTNGNDGVIRGIPRLLKLLEKHKIKATFFVTGEVLKENEKIIRLVAKKGHEIGIHGYSHKRFDSLSEKEKDDEIRKSLEIYKGLFNKKPRGFRAPQHSADSKTIRLLNKYGFKYDSSVCAWNLMLLRHLFKRNSNKSEILSSFFGKIHPYKTLDILWEIPRASPVLALGGFELKVYPNYLIKTIFWLHGLFNIPVNFVMHSWDMIEIKESRTSKHCTIEEFEERLERLIEIIKDEYDIVKMEEIADGKE